MTKSSLASFQKDILTKSLLYGTDTRLGGGGGGKEGLAGEWDQMELKVDLRRGE